MNAKMLIKLCLLMALSTFNSCGENAFVIQYQVGSALAAGEDLAAGIEYIFRHSKELQVDTAGYSVWGSSAGARMAAYIGSYGIEAFGAARLPRPCTVVMAYTGTTNTPAKTRQPIRSWEATTASPIPTRCADALKPCKASASLQSSTCIPTCATGSDWVSGQVPRDGLTEPSASGRETDKRCDRPRPSKNI